MNMNLIVDEYLKYLVPLVIFLLGIYFSGYVERRKFKYQQDRNLRNLKIEIQDEVSEIENYMSKIVETFQCTTDYIETIKNPEFMSLPGGSIKYIPKNITLFFLEPTIRDCYYILNKEQRFALKVLTGNIRHFNQNLSDYGDLHLSKCSTEDFERVSSEYVDVQKRLILDSLTLRALFKSFLDKGNTWRYLQESRRELITSQLNELALDLKYEDLISLKKITTHY